MHHPIPHRFPNNGLYLCLVLPFTLFFPAALVRDNLIYCPVGFGPFGPFGRGLLGASEYFGELVFWGKNLGCTLGIGTKESKFLRS